MLDLYWAFNLVMGFACVSGVANFVGGFCALMQEWRE